jgi:hypothetical protein
VHVLAVHVNHVNSALVRRICHAGNPLRRQHAQLLLAAALHNVPYNAACSHRLRHFQQHDLHGISGGPDAPSVLHKQHPLQPGQQMVAVTQPLQGLSTAKRGRGGHWLADLHDGPVHPSCGSIGSARFGGDFNR